MLRNERKTLVLKVWMWERGDGFTLRKYLFGISLGYAVNSEMISSLHGN